MNDLLMVADNQQLALMAFLILSAAFDTVDHSMLLLRLQFMFGVSGDALASYLTGRTQSVKIGSMMFKERILKCLSLKVLFLANIYIVTIEYL